MKIYRCDKDNKLISELGLAKGVCLGHDLLVYSDDEKEDVKKVFISIPTEGHTQSEAYDNHLVLMQRLGGLQERWRYEKRSPRYEFSFYTTGRLLTQMARERLMKVALAGGADYVIMFDDDMLLPLDMIERMLEDMEQHPEIDILAALAFMRNAPHYPVLYTIREGFDNVRHTSYYRNEVNPKYPRNKLVEADAVGFGAVCIRMDMVRRMTEKVGDGQFFMSTTATGEDIMFCVNAKKYADARIFMDTRIKTGHLTNPKIVDEGYFDKWVKDNKHDIGNKKYKYAVDESDVDSEFLSYDKGLELER